MYNLLSTLDKTVKSEGFVFFVCAVVHHPHSKRVVLRKTGFVLFVYFFVFLMV